MIARIYLPSKTAMQSGKALTRKWILEFDALHARRIDPLMGWVSSDDMSGQVRLSFPSVDAAIAYCQERKIPHEIVPNPTRTRPGKSYADNFTYYRKEPWTH